MLRNDFVSNSSSSSFIVTENDNKFDILLREYDVLDLKAYIDHFLIHDSFNDIWNYLYQKQSPKFVSDVKYNSCFKYNLWNTFPILAKPIVEKLITSVEKDGKSLYDGTYKSDIDTLKDICTKALELKWKNTKFHYAEIETTYLDDSENKHSGIDNEVELTEERIDYFRDLKQLEFYRKFSNC